MAVGMTNAIVIMDNMGALAARSAVFFDSGNFTVPADIEAIYVTACAGGGSGAYGYSVNNDPYLQPGSAGGNTVIGSLQTLIGGGGGGGDGNPGVAGDSSAGGAGVSSKYAGCGAGGARAGGGSLGGGGGWYSNVGTGNAGGGRSLLGWHGQDGGNPAQTNGSGPYITGYSPGGEPGNSASGSAGGYGGGGGFRHNYGYTGCGGGGGALIYRKKFTVTPAAVIAITIGAGGAGNGGNGGKGIAIIEW